MKALIIGGVRPFHKKIAELGASCVLIIPRAAADPSDLQGPYESVHVLPMSASSQDYVTLAEALNDKIPFTAVCAFHEDFQKLAIPIAAALGLPFVSESSVLNASDKNRMREILRAAGVDPTANHRVRTLEEALKAFAAVGAPCIMKPIAGTGSDRIFRINRAEDLARICETELSNGAEFVIEPFHVGPEYSVEAISEGGVHRILATTLKYKNSETFVEEGHLVPAPLRSEDQRLIEEYSIAILNALGITDGPSHTELILTSDGPRVVETHTRAGGDGIVELVEMASGVKFLELVARQSLGEKVIDEVPEKLEFKKCAAVWYGFPESLGKVAEVKGVEEASAEPGVTSVRVLKGVGTEHKKVTHSFMRTTCAFATHISADEALLGCQNALAKISFRLEA